jgi:hypothetical protein
MPSGSPSRSSGAAQGVGAGATVNRHADDQPAAAADEMLTPSPRPSPDSGRMPARGSSSSQGRARARRWTALGMVGAERAGFEFEHHIDHSADAVLRPAVHSAAPFLAGNRSARLGGGPVAERLAPLRGRHRIDVEDGEAAAFADARAQQGHAAASKTNSCSSIAWLPIGTRNLSSVLTLSTDFLGSGLWHPAKEGHSRMGVEAYNPFG